MPSIFYVDGKDGNDGNDGLSQGNAWLTPNFAETQTTDFNLGIKGGDVFFIRGDNTFVLTARLTFGANTRGSTWIGTDDLWRSEVGSTIADFAGLQSSDFDATQIPRLFILK